MDHIVFLDKKSKELENILLMKKDVIVRGATGRKLPYGRVSIGDILYLVNNNGEGLIKAKCTVKSVLFTDKLTTDESNDLYDSYKERSLLDKRTEKRFRGKRYLTIMEINNVVVLDNQPFDKTDFMNMDDWLLVEDIKKVLN